MIKSEKLMVMYIFLKEMGLLGLGMHSVVESKALGLIPSTGKKKNKKGSKVHFKVLFSSSVMVLL
jgi:hypothetical protein